MRRLYTIDALRGLAVIAMIIFHTLWDLKYMFGVKMTWFDLSFRQVLASSIGFTFILISGFCYKLGRHHLSNAVQVLLGAAVIFAVTYIIMPDSAIYFGILTFIGSMMLLMIPLSRLLDRANPYITLLAATLFFVLLINLRLGYIGIGPISVKLPKWLYANKLTAYFGFPPLGFSSADYYPLLPWAPLYIAGYSLSAIYQKHSPEKLLTRIRIPPLEFIGRHSLVVYLVHQPVISAILYLIFIILF